MKILRVPRQVLWVAPLVLVSGAMAWHTFDRLRHEPDDKNVTMSSMNCPSKARKREAMGLPVEVSRPHCQQCRAPLLGAPLVLAPRMLGSPAGGARWVRALALAERSARLL